MKTLWLPILICTLMGIKTIVGDFGLDVIKESLIPKETEGETAKEDSKHPADNSGTTEDRGRLINRILNDYDKRNYPTNTTLKFGLALINVDIDEDRHTLEAQSWLRMVWNDPRLSWDQKEYDVGIVRLPSDEVWKPDMTLYNSADHFGMVKCWGSNVLVYSNGDVLWVPPCHLSGFCNTDKLSTEPYGPLQCMLKFGSWTFNSHFLQLELYKGKMEADLTDMWKNNWDVTENVASIEEKYYSCCTEPYGSIMFNITVQRHHHCH